MNRNEYRRAFIMLRAAMPGYGGHVRLEKRTLTGSMYFIITAPQGVSELSAALVGQRDGACYAAPIGPLVRDRRGQLVLAWTFDPRNIAGRPLEAYAWVAIVATGGPCALALTGNVEGSRPVDARALAAAACGLFAPGQAAPGDDAPAADIPGPCEDAPVPTTEPAPAEPAPVPNPDAEVRGDVKVYTLKRSRLRRVTDRAAAPAKPLTPQADPAPEIPASQADPAPEIPAPQADPAPEIPASQVDPAPERLTPSAGPMPETLAPVTAAKALGLDITAPWPGAAEPLRRLFATQVPAPSKAPAPDESLARNESLAPDDGFTYVAVPMPAGSGYDHSLVGLKVRDGQIVAIRHALPALRAPEPPAGMEAAAWVPGNGEAGFWVVDEPE